MLCDARVDISSKGTSRIKLQHPTTREDPDLKLQLTNKRRERFGAWILVSLDVGCWMFVRGGELPLEGICGGAQTDSIPSRSGYHPYQSKHHAANYRCLLSIDRAAVQNWLAVSH